MAFPSPLVVSKCSYVKLNIIMYVNSHKKMTGECMTWEMEIWNHKSFTNEYNYKKWDMYLKSPSGTRITMIFRSFLHQTSLEIGVECNLIVFALGIPHCYVISIFFLFSIKKLFYKKDKYGEMGVDIPWQYV